MTGIRILLILQIIEVGLLSAYQNSAVLQYSSEAQDELRRGTPIALNVNHRTCKCSGEGASGRACPVVLHCAL